MRRSSGVPEQVRSSSPSSSCSSPVRSIRCVPLHIPVPRLQPRAGPEPRRMNRTLRLRSGSSVSCRSTRVRVYLGPVRLILVRFPNPGPEEDQPVQKFHFSLSQNQIRTACTSVHVRPAPSPAESGSGPGAHSGFMGSYVTPRIQNPATFTEPSSGWTHSWNFTTPSEFLSEPDRAERTGSDLERPEQSAESWVAAEERLIWLPAEL